MSIDKSKTPPIHNDFFIGYPIEEFKRSAIKSIPIVIARQRWHKKLRSTFKKFACNYITKSLLSGAMNITSAFIIMNFIIGDLQLKPKPFVIQTIITPEITTTKLPKLTR